jgi:hypothetical protein
MTTCPESSQQRTFGKDLGACCVACDGAEQLHRGRILFPAFNSQRSLTDCRKDNRRLEQK